MFCILASCELEFDTSGLVDENDQMSTNWERPFRQKHFCVGCCSSPGEHLEDVYAPISSGHDSSIDNLQDSNSGWVEVPGVIKVFRRDMLLITGMPHVHKPNPDGKFRDTNAQIGWRHLLCFTVCLSGETSCQRQTTCHSDSDAAKGDVYIRMLL